LTGQQEPRVKSLHQDAVVVDALNPLVAWDVRRRRNAGEKAVISRVLYDELQKGGVDVVNSTVYGPAPFGEPSMSFAIESLGAMLMDLAESSDRAVLVRKFEDIDEAERNHKLAVIFGFQGLPPLKWNLAYLTVFHTLGVRIIQITYNERNEIGDGCTERSNSGLSNFGAKVVEELNRLGILIDLSHVGKSTFMETLELSRSPVIVSHANARSVCDHPRNLTDEQIQAVAKKGGVVGINSFGPFVSRDKPTVEDVVHHVDYMAKLVGPDHVGLGLDLSYHTNGSGTYPDIYNPPGHVGVKGLERVSDLRNVTSGLLKKGYSAEDVKKILGGNFLRIFKRVLS
jgi:membrane dipeptidase